MTTRRVFARTNEETAVGRLFFDKYRHAWCRDGKSGREGALMDVRGELVDLRGSKGLEFSCEVRDLAVLKPPPPPPYAQVRYIGEEGGKERPPGQITDMWAVRGGAMAIVQPRVGHAWFALAAHLEWAPCPLPLGPVAAWAEPPYLPGEQE